MAMFYIATVGVVAFSFAAYYVINLLYEIKLIQQKRLESEQNIDRFLSAICEHCIPRKS